MIAAALIGLRRGHESRLAARLRNEDGIGLVELLIALLVLNIGIFATLGAFTSAATTLRRASHISTAAAIADKQMETFRDGSYDNIVAIPTPGTAQTGADGLTYTLIVSVGSGQVTGGSANVKLVTITVYEGAPGSGGKQLVTSSSTFSKCAQAAGNASDTTSCQS